MVSAHKFLTDPEARRQAVTEYRETGYIVLREVFAPAELSQMHHTWAAIGEDRQQQGKRPYTTLLMTHLSNSGVAEIVRNRALLGCVEGLLDGRIELIQSQLMFGIPGNKGFSPHQDNFYNRAEPKDGIIAAWIALENVDEENGCLAVFPRSHLNGLAKTRRDWLYLLSRAPDVAKSLIRLTSSKARTLPNDSGVIERYVYAEAPDNAKAVAVTMEEGSVVFMHGDTIHYSYPNRTTDRFRRSLLTNYVRVGTTFAAGKLTGRVPFDVYAA